MSQLPTHVAIIMDGNGRWAKKRLLPRNLGHQAGLKSTRKIIQTCVNHKIKALTLFAFSSENWNRPKKEVGLLMDLFFTALRAEVKKLNENNVRMNFIGDLSAFSEKLQNRISESIDILSSNTGLELNVAVNYGGRWDITNAVQQIAEKISNGDLDKADITESLISSHISLSHLPEPDLFIRTGGDTRISNFLLWQLAYTELYFTDKLWPDFDEAVFNDALQSFTSRQRRFGCTGDQVEEVCKNV